LRKVFILGSEILYWEPKYEFRSELPRLERARFFAPLTPNFYKRVYKRDSFLLTLPRKEWDKK